jgi:asparagine synthase (glutamine-hydrolysing)
VCGIAGLILTPPGLVKAEWMENMLRHLEHRGPDDCGWLSFYRGKLDRGRDIPNDLLASVALLHRRLSIVDLSEAGWQPMGTPDGRYWIVFNGEIYNYLELRKELEALGHRFRSRSDTEVLLAAFAEWGVSSLNRLMGMFAFAILDVEARKIVLARDFFGIKPLYYTYWQDGFAFASEITALLDLPGIDRSVNAARLYEYLRAGITDYGDQTFFAHVKQLPAAHYMEVSLDNPLSAQPTRYWQIDLHEKAELSFDEAAEELRDLFLDSIRLHLRSDVPVGAALSGGIDSSSIVAAMRLLDPKLEIHTFSYIADDPTISEERWVDKLGKAARLVVHKVKLTSDELMADLDHLIGVQGEPFGSTSMYAQSRIFREARKAGIKVMLDGQGADELLAGYPTYIGARIGSLLRQGHWAEAIGLWRAASKLPGASGLRTLPQVVGFFVPSNLKGPVRHLLGRDRPPAWLNESWFSERGANESSLRCLNGNDHQGNELLKHELYLSLTETSLPQLLHYEDRNSMAFSIESRVPFLTPALANFLFALPEDYIIATDGTTKAVFRRAMRGIVPDAILDRRDKLGFPTPEKHWLLSSGTWIERVLASEAAMQIQAIESEEVQREWEKIVRGSRPFDSRVWRWVNLILWVQKFSVSVG